MKAKRFVSFLLALCMVVGLLPGTALAASSAAAGGMGNFRRDGSYQDGTFNDVSADAWYAEGVSAAYELGLMKGSGAGAFSPQGNVTVAEAIAMAARLHRRYSSGKDDFVQGSPWYQVYVDYATTNGILSGDDFPGGYGANITRAQMAHLFAAALPETELAAVNTVDELPDVNASTPYNKDIFLLYRAGVLTGNDEQGTFTPDTPISRSQVATIIARMALPSMRKSTWAICPRTNGMPSGESSPVETSCVNRLADGSITVHSCTVQPLDNGYVRYTLDYTAPKGLDVGIFDRSTTGGGGGDLFNMMYNFKTSDARSTLTYDVQIERVAAAAETCIKFVRGESASDFCVVLVPGYQK